jgi:hypothetical protein
LALPFEPGRPCGPLDVETRLLEAIGTHTAFVARAFPAARSPSLDELQRMIETNVAESDASLRVPPLAAWGPTLASAPAAAIDGRMQPHEWIRTATGFIKVDALDHSSDHFYPGSQDPAWDLAGAETEFDLDADGSRAVIGQYVRMSGDRDVRARLPFYRVAYAAFQVGYATFARQSLGESPDGRRFEARRAVFLARLRRAVAGASSQ